MQKNRHRTPWALRLVLLSAALAACALVLFWQSAFANLFWQAGAPVLGLRNAFSQTEVSMLKAQLASTTAALADRDALYSQNLALKNLLGRPQTGGRVLGAVLLRPPGTPYDTLIIDAGIKDGLAVGNTVFAGGTAAIGEVSDVYAGTARVILFSAPGRTYQAQVSPRATSGSVIPVSLEGQGAGSFTGQVPAGSAIAEGDAVTIPGIGNEFLGSISHVAVADGSSFETLYVRMPVSIFSLQYVEVQTHI
jgi:cell shape-determining protein MreC